MTRTLFDTESIFGIHEPGGEHHMLELGRSGWIVFTRALSNSDDFSMADFSQWSDRGLGIICRLNHGYEPVGTIPPSAQYQEFARRCAEFIARSKGCKIWIIGNEMNLPVERPQVVSASGFAPQAAPRIPHPVREQLRSEEDRASLLQPKPIPQAPPQAGSGAAAAATAPNAANQIINQRQVITPDLYADCYRRCRAAIHAVPGHADDQVLIGAVAPWNNETRYAANPNGDWVTYFEEILTTVGANNCDGITIHAYTHTSDPNSISAHVPMGHPFGHRQFEFKVYQDFMQAIPAAMRHLPVYITETDQVHPWHDTNNGWIQAAYGEINWWNAQPGNQQIRSLVLYRWPNIDPWVIDGKQGVIMDFRSALQHDYRWRFALPKPLKLSKGDVVETLDSVNLRKTPGTAGKTIDDIVKLIPSSTRLSIRDTSHATVDGLVWWQVELPAADNAGVSLFGWLAQFSQSGSPLLEKSATRIIVPPPEKIKIAKGGIVKTRDFVRVRKSAGFAGKSAEDTLTILSADVELIVTEGPVQKDGLTWWRLRGSSSGLSVDGWVAERTPADVLLLEAVTTSQSDLMPPQSVPGAGMASSAADRPASATTLDYVRIRKSPGFVGKPNDDILGQIDPGIEVEILAGPESKDALTWWQVAVSPALAGWVAENSPAGIKLLRIEENGVIPEHVKTFRRGDLVQTATALRVRRTPGISANADDVLGLFLANATLNIIDGPVAGGGLRWWRVGGILDSGSEVIGYVAEALADGTQLIQYAPRLPNTSMPDYERGRFLNLPFQGQWGIAQLWGENPQIYSAITYDGIPLRGHNGIDFLTPTGTNLLAVDEGVVVDAIMNDPTGFGNYVKLQHGWGESLYAHMQSLSVSAGQQVTRGQVIGKSNNTGFSKGPHLHFSIRIGSYDRRDGWGGFRDPLPYFDPSEIQMPVYVQPSTPTRGIQAQAAIIEPPGIGYAPDQPGIRRP